MRPAAGVALEMLALALVLASSLLVPPGLPFAIYILVAELLSTYLIHCPAHFAVGSAVGIRFRSMRLGKTALAKVLPPKMASFARLFPILTLSTEKSSLARVSRTKVAAMYASGTIASVGSAMAIAAASVVFEPYPFAAAAWAIALLYLGFDALFSPRSGDIYRARIAARILSA